MTFTMMGICLACVIGFLPELGVMTALAIMIPMIYTMNPIKALSFLMSAHAVCYNGGSVIAVFFNIPGTTLNAATVLDGFPMTQNGMGVRALGNALAA